MLHIQHNEIYLFEVKKGMPISGQIKQLSPSTGAVRMPMLPPKSGR
jgi:hypothetical protein